MGTGPSRPIVRYPTRSGDAGPSTESSGVSLPGPSCQVAVRSESPILPATRDSKLSFMASALPEVPVVRLKFLLELYDDDLDKAMHLFLGEFSLSSLVGILKSCCCVDEADVRRIEVNGFDVITFCVCVCVCVITLYRVCVLSHCTVCVYHVYRLCMYAMCTVCVCMTRVYHQGFIQARW